MKVIKHKKIVYISEYECEFCDSVFKSPSDAERHETQHRISQCKHANATYEIYNYENYYTIALVCKECCSSPWYVINEWDLSNLPDHTQKEILQQIVQLIEKAKTHGAHN